MNVLVHFDFKSYLNMVEVDIYPEVCGFPKIFSPHLHPIWNMASLREEYERMNERTVISDLMESTAPTLPARPTKPLSTLSLG